MSSSRIDIGESIWNSSKDVFNKAESVSNDRATKLKKHIRKWLKFWMKKIITPAISDIYSEYPELTCKMIIMRINCCSQMLSCYEKLYDLWCVSSRKTNKLLYELIQNYHQYHDITLNEFKNLKYKLPITLLNKLDLLLSQIDDIDKQCKDLWFYIPLPNISDKIAKKSWAIEYYLMNTIPVIWKYSFFKWLIVDAKLVDFDFNYNNLDSSIPYIIRSLFFQWILWADYLDYTDNMRDFDAKLLSEKLPPVFDFEFSDIFVEITSFTFAYLDTIKKFFESLLNINCFWLKLINDWAWLKYIVRKIFDEKEIDYNDKILDKCYDDFLWCLWKHKKWIFASSQLDFFADLWDHSFMWSAWDSLLKSANDESAIAGLNVKKWFVRECLIVRLEAMYGSETMERMMKKIDSWTYKDESWRIDIEILRDLIFTLWSIHGISHSSLPKSFLSKPENRCTYSLSLFLVMCTTWLWQWAKEVCNLHWNVAAWWWIMYVSILFVLLWFEKDKKIWSSIRKHDEKYLWNRINDSKNVSKWVSYFRFLSNYDLVIYKSQWLYWLLFSKILFSFTDLSVDIFNVLHSLNDDYSIALLNSTSDSAFTKLLYKILWSDFYKINDDNIDYIYELLPRKIKKKKRKRNIILILVGLILLFSIWVLYYMFIY